MPEVAIKVRTYNIEDEPVVHELDRLLEAVMGRLPANPASVMGRRHERRYARLMARYFNDLKNAFPYDELTVIYNRHVTVESFREAGPIGEANDVMTPLLRMFRAKLLVDVVGQHVSMYLLASAEMMTWGMTKSGLPIAYEGPPMERAIKYAEKHCAQLVTRMDVESKRVIAKAVKDGIANKRGVDGLARDIRARFADMSRNRAQVIARTETCDALEQGFMDRAHDMGINGKEWVTNEPCEICEENENAGVIPIDGIFPSGHERPPAHPNCECALAPVVIAREAIEEVMTPSKWKAEYKKGVPHWAKDVEPSVFAKEFVKLMKEHETESVLEVGCGNGRDSILFATSGFEVTSIDVVPKAVELAKGNAKKAEVSIEFKVANVEKLPFEDANFGAVFTLSVLHSTDLKKSLPEVTRVLQLSGVAFIYIYGDTQFENGDEKEVTIGWRTYLAALRELGFKILTSYVEQEDEFDGFGEKHSIFVVLLQKRAS